MLNKKDARLLFLFIRYSGYLVPRPLNDYVKISKTMHPFLVGKRDIYYFYELEKSLYGIRATLEVFKNIVANEGKILFISDSLPLQSCFSRDPNIDCIKWKRGSILKSKNADLVFLSNINKENMVEAHRKCLLLVGLGSPTMSKIAYPFNLNLDSSFLSDWFFGAIYTSYVQGKRLSNKSKNKNLSLLGKGQLKINKNEI
uniref:Ribosomal protein S2 n=1 Tax=Pleurocladia lacustris TaxID=246121 RepID=A0A1I9LW90_9PHAE|nr:ribosomal protein S2 [Pleurocladia lacustris]